MKTLLRRLFGHPSVVNPQRDDFTKDTHGFFTDVDRAEGVKRLTQIYEPFKVIQRFLALCIVLTYLAVWGLCVLLFVIYITVFIIEAVRSDVSMLAQFNEIKHNIDGVFFLNAIKELARLNQDTLGIPAGLVLSLYFGGGFVEGVMERFPSRNITRGDTPPTTNVKE